MTSMCLESMIESGTAGVASAMLHPNHHLLCESNTMADDILPLKTCKLCRRSLPLSDFNANQTMRDRLSGKCKKCESAYARARYSSVPEEYKNRARQWKLNNPDRKKERDRAYRERNRDQINERKRIRYREISRNDPKELLCRNISLGIRRSLVDGKEGRCWEDLVGYTAEELFRHLTKTMPNGYDWSDYAKGRLHIDHKIPIAVHHFKAHADRDFHRCWDLKNLRLLPAQENVTKRHKITKPFQPSLAGI